MEKLLRLRSNVEKNRDVIFELVRIYLGLGLFAKGVYFVDHMSDVMNVLVRGNLQFWGFLIGHYIGLAHLAGGLLLIAGLLTRAAALSQVPILVGAVFVVHLREGFFGSSANLEFSLLVLFLLVLTLVHGGGRLSADSWMSQRKALLEGGGLHPQGL